MRITHSITLQLGTGTIQDKDAFDNFISLYSSLATYVVLAFLYAGGGGS